MHPAPDDAAGRDLFQSEVVQVARPAVLRGLVADWPVVKAAQPSPRALRDYLAKFDGGARVEVFFGDPAIRGKYYYNPGLQGFNFERRMMKLIDAVDSVLAATGQADTQSVYVGSMPAADCLPGFAADNPMPLVTSGGGPRI